jgi:hypothetical protein
MISPTADQQDFPVLVVAYDDKARATIAASPLPFGVRAVQCASFSEAQDHALAACHRGIMVDLVTMIKAKDLEKIIAHTLTSIFPTMRVKSMGPMLIPMIMAGDAQQDKSLKDFFTKTCMGFAPRMLRSHKRKELCLPTLIGGRRGFSVNISWSGAFIADMAPECFAIGQELTLTLLCGPADELILEAVVVRIQSWGERRPPGLGVRFKALDQETEGRMCALLRSEKDTDRDRMA